MKAETYAVPGGEWWGFRIDDIDAVGYRTEAAARAVMIALLAGAGLCQRGHKLGYVGKRRACVECRNAARRVKP